ncbi:hypothetical protein K1X13_13530 [Nocardioides sp. WL0053]|uniref:Uncharacterized protein n=1 Tax=Nocardioides jiangsuensis TaxID=2866161 RepID=A0ABS7RP74_9ACTN|nr:hypothetical protein [Nocardioides jiangsuensis]MBY9075848.1 hypothetical protein [Nocardioides jiangsuensis]
MDPDMRVLAQRVIDQQLRSLGVFLRGASDALDDPASSTPARADLDHVSGHPDKEDLMGCAGGHTAQPP